MNLALFVIISILSVVGIIIALVLFMMNHFMDDHFITRDWEGEPIRRFETIGSDGSERRNGLGLFGL